MLELCAKTFFDVRSDGTKFRPCLMLFIARCGLFVLSVLVIFAFLEVRYDTLRRRDTDSISVTRLPTACFRV